MCTILYIWIHSSFSMNATTGLSAILMTKVLIFTQKKEHTLRGKNWKEEHEYLKRVYKNLLYKTIRIYFMFFLPLYSTVH